MSVPKHWILSNWLLGIDCCRFFCRSARSFGFFVKCCSYRWVQDNELKPLRIGVMLSD